MMVLASRRTEIKLSSASFITNKNNEEEQINDNMKHCKE
jgi:hypothetical protein